MCGSLAVGSKVGSAKLFPNLEAASLGIFKGAGFKLALLESLRSMKVKTPQTTLETLPLNATRVSSCARRNRSSHTARTPTTLAPGRVSGTILNTRYRSSTLVMHFEIMTFRASRARFDGRWNLAWGQLKTRLESTRVLAVQSVESKRRVRTEYTDAQQKTSVYI